VTEDLPVWAYWEGPCPPWIQACRQTLERHASTLRLLSPESFAVLWDRDRDIRIDRLCVAHRADFIRAFLLARYGGLWVDSDCVVMRPLGPLLTQLKEHDFVAHRERSGFVSNGFIGARAGSPIAVEFYQRVCSTLRSGQSPGWISLGGEPLTHLLGRRDSSWLELPVESIQPICWSKPAEFFSQADAAEHEQHFDPTSLCYMLSNQEILKFQAKNPAADLLHPRSFFNFLLHRAQTPSSSEGALDLPLPVDT